ncbi:interferon-stimulated 20 kDa exonuclease-like 2 [Pseudochaenichthys georgianus]|uniref:interferon-stimulated 20 kDa exonuclease-like 2 n=1 Tax=Pseudochaenichthys georgianus TaxID=52239 RepID=UPI00146AC35B|nr:interferon-stimulated 20 kDa exonuclease-like 2 [Pseudochaenichthys georgianus]
MSNILINVSLSDEPAQKRPPAANWKNKNKQYRKKPREFEHRASSSLEGRNNYNHRTGQVLPPRQNGANHSAPQTSSNNTTLPSNSLCSASPSTSAQCQEKPNDSGNTKPSPPCSSSQKPTTTQSSSSSAAAMPTKFLAIDCEMVGTGPKGSNSQLARCSLVSYDGDVVYDKFINPPVPITDYRTRWSGIRQRDLVNATPYIEARKEILRLLMGKVVIGHAIHNDFKVLGYAHPGVLTRDTSRIPLLNRRAGFAPNEVASLKRLTKAIFNRDIQTGRKGHSSVEDARATMQLYRVVEEQWERTLASKAQNT